VSDHVVAVAGFGSRWEWSCSCGAVQRWSWSESQARRNGGNHAAMAGRESRGRKVGAPGSCGHCGESWHSASSVLGEACSTSAIAARWMLASNGTCRGAASRFGVTHQAVSLAAGRMREWLAAQGAQNVGTHAVEEHW
jgi:hypothetical protein